MYTKETVNGVSLNYSRMAYAISQFLSWRQLFYPRVHNALFLLSLGKANNVSLQTGTRYDMIASAQEAVYVLPFPSRYHPSHSVRYHPQFSRPLCLMMTNLVACLPICDVYQIGPARLPHGTVVGVIMFIFRYCSRSHLGHVAPSGRSLVRQERATRANHGRAHVHAATPDTGPIIEIAKPSIESEWLHLTDHIGSTTSCECDSKGACFRLWAGEARSTQLIGLANFRK